MKKLIIGVRCYQQVSCLSTYLSLVLHATTHSNTAKRHRQVMPLIRLHVRWIDNLLRLSFIRSPRRWSRGSRLSGNMRSNLIVWKINGSISLLRLALVLIIHHGIFQTDGSWSVERSTQPTYKQVCKRTFLSYCLTWREWNHPLI